jgi:hypothetical protein
MAGSVGETFLKVHGNPRCCENVVLDFLNVSVCRIAQGFDLMRTLLQAGQDFDIDVEVLVFVQSLHIC